MNEQRYHSLCAACDHVLLSPGSTVERIAIPWLHIIREHPVFLANYTDLFELAAGSPALLGMLHRSLRRRAEWLQQFLRSVRADRKPWIGPKVMPDRPDVLFISHLLNDSQAGQTRDFYFGNLPDEMVHRGYSVAISLINHSGQAAGPLAEKWTGCAAPRIVLSGSLGFGEELTLRRRLRKESSRLRGLADASPPGLERRVCARAAEEAVSGSSLTALRIAAQIGALIATMKPKAIVVTHEGHSWERAAFAAARKAFPQVKCIGYQHAALFRLQHAIRRNLADKYNPDHILTAGTVSKGQLESVKGLNGIPTSILGSNRALEGVNTHSRPWAANQAASRERAACLVLPEGIASECHLLFNFSLKCARVYPEMQFIWRLHPIISFRSLAAKNKNLRNLPSNMILSQTTLEEDLSRCSWALYRGTTAVVQAVVAGLRPVYLQLTDELTVDPLYELGAWRTVVRSVADFCAQIQFGQNAAFGGTESEFHKANRYCREIFTPMEPRALEEIISG